MAILPVRLLNVDADVVALKAKVGAGVSGPALDQFLIGAGPGSSAWGILQSAHILTALGYTPADAVALAAHIANVANPHAVTKAQVGLTNVDNTSDASKPVSTAQATAIALKQDITAFLTALLAIGDPNADRLYFWDDSAGVPAALALGNGLVITGTTIDATGGAAVYSLQPVENFTSVAATLTEIAAAGYTIPGNSAVVGRAYRITARGTFANSSGAGRVMNSHIRLGGNTIASSGNITIPTATSGRVWQIMWDGVVKAIGAGGTIESYGTMFNVNAITDISAATPQTFNTTADRKLTLAFTGETTAVTATINQLIVQVL